MLKKVDIEPFKNKVWLSTPTMHGEELKYMQKAYETNWMSTVGENINEVEKLSCDQVGCDYSVALASGTAALHMAVKAAGVELYGEREVSHGTLEGKRVFCSDLTFCATINPVVYEGGIPVFIDSEYETWNMDPIALEKAFEKYPDVKLVVLVHLYGVPAKLKEIKAICEKHGAMLIEDAAESMGATYNDIQTGNFGDISIQSYNGNKIITGSSGGVLLTNIKKIADRVRKWSTQSREQVEWYQHNELGYNYRMSNVIAGVVRGQYPYLREHIEQKKAIYMRYKEGLKDLPIQMNPYGADNAEPNFWLSCMIIDKEAMCKQVRGEKEAIYTSEPGKSCPTEILEEVAKLNAEGRPIWKPMHMQPVFRNNDFVTQFSNNMQRKQINVSEDIFNRGVCLPSDNKMSEHQQSKIIEIIKGCFE